MTTLQFILFWYACSFMSLAILYKTSGISHVIGTVFYIVSGPIGLLLAAGKAVWKSH